MSIHSPLNLNGVLQLNAQAPKLPVRENDAGQVFVANLTALPIESVADFDKIYS